MTSITMTKKQLPTQASAPQPMWTQPAGGLAVRTNLRAGRSYDKFLAKINASFQQLMNAQNDVTASTPDTTTTTTA